MVLNLEITPKRGRGKKRSKKGSKKKGISFRSRRSSDPGLLGQVGVTVFLISGPNCKYCDWAKRLLGKHQIKYREISLASHRRRELFRRTGLRTVPQIFYRRDTQHLQHIGGYDDLVSFLRKKPTSR